MAWPPPPPPKESLPYLPTPALLEHDGKVKRIVNEKQFSTSIGRKYLRVVHDPYRREAN